MRIGEGFALLCSPELARTPAELGSDKRVEVTIDSRTDLVSARLGRRAGLPAMAFTAGFGSSMRVEGRRPSQRGHDTSRR